MAWQQGTVTDFQDMLVKLIAMCVNDHVETVAVNAGGTGYVVGDILTVAGGTVEETLVATLEVTSETGGVVDGIKVNEGGAYSADPTLTANAVTGGTGSGATMDLTMLATGWTTQRNVTSGAPLEREWIAKGTGSGSDEIFVGIRTIRDLGPGSYNWELGGFTGFNGANAWADQAGYNGTDNIFAYTLLLDAPMEFWFSVTPRRIIGIMKGGTGYANFYMGFLNTFATPTEYPYPLYIAGCTATINRTLGNSDDKASGLCDPRRDDATPLGPSALRFVDGAWYDVVNRSVTAQQVQRVIWPIAEISNVSTSYPVSSALEDRFYTLISHNSWKSFVQHAASNPTIGNFHSTDDSGGNISHLIPTVIIFDVPSSQIVGELDDVFWVHAAGNNLLSEDTLIKNGERYFIFNNVQRSDAWSLLAIKQG